MSKVKPIKSLEQQIEEYKTQANFTQKFNKWDDSGDTYTLWHWDEDWDGQLLTDVKALHYIGFTIKSFSRKRKITLVNDQMRRSDVVKLISQAVGDTWYSISFKPTLSIYWKGRSSTWL